MIGERLLPGSLRRAGKAIPLARLLLIGELAVLAGRHIARLDARERSRLLFLLRKGRGRPRALDDDERAELFELIARVDPQAFVGTAVRRLSPVPVPGWWAFQRGASIVARALRRRS
jgi:hypothetical protein